MSVDKKSFKISAIQMNSKLGDKKANFDKVKCLIQRDVNAADVIILPEVWTCGWAPRLFRESAEELQNSETLKFLSQIAIDKNSWIVGGSFILKQNNRYYNTCPVLNRKGELIALYSKNHLFSYYGSNEGEYVQVGDNPVIVEIEGIKVGLTICYDIRFPEIYRAYRKAGADLFVNCAAWGLSKPIPWECMTRSRAVENQTFIVALTQSGYIENEDWNIGHSRIIDYKGESLAEIKDQQEGAVSAVLDFSSMYEFRKKCTCLNDIRENYEVKSL